MKKHITSCAVKRPRFLWLSLVSLLCILLMSAVASKTLTLSQAQAAAIPSPRHVVIVIEENHSNTQIIGSSNAPYINLLVRQGASFTNSHGITHPSEPNYQALYSGS